jgi:hypothetical protein
VPSSNPTCTSIALGVGAFDQLAALVLLTHYDELVAARHISICFGPRPLILEEAARRLATAWTEFAPNAISMTTLTGN